MLFWGRNLPICHVRDDGIEMKDRGARHAVSCPDRELVARCLDETHRQTTLILFVDGDDIARHRSYASRREGECKRSKQSRELEKCKVSGWLGTANPESRVFEWSFGQLNFYTRLGQI